MSGVMIRNALPRSPAFANLHQGEAILDSSEDENKVLTNRLEVLEEWDSP